jgi:sugar phosphate isomerase/epimerase
MERREFLAGCGMLLLGARTGQAQARGAAALGGQDRSAKLARIGVLSWSLHTMWEKDQPPGTPAPAKPWDFLDYPDLIADTFGVHNLEVQDENFASSEDSYINEFIARMKKARSRMTNICLEVGSYVSDPDPQKRASATDHTKKWVDHAVRLGSPSVMIDQGSITRANMDDAVAALKPAVEYGKTKGVFVTIENRSEKDPTLLPDVMRASGAGANPDIGNFPDDDTRERGMKALLPLTSNNVHVKMRPGRYDVTHYIQMVKDSGFKGTFSIESDRSLNPDPLKAVQVILDQLLIDL